MAQPAEFSAADLASLICVYDGGAWQSLLEAFQQGATPSEHSTEKGRAECAAAVTAMLQGYRDAMGTRTLLVTMSVAETHETPASTVEVWQIDDASGSIEGFQVRDNRGDITADFATLAAALTGATNVVKSYTIGG